MRTPPIRGLTVHWPPHSATFAACQAGPRADAPHNGTAARTAVSVVRPPEDDIGTGLQRGHVGFRAHQGDDMLA